MTRHKRETETKSEPGEIPSRATAIERFLADGVWIAMSGRAISEGMCEAAKAPFQAGDPARVGEHRRAADTEVNKSTFGAETMARVERLERSGKRAANDVFALNERAS